ncbi:MAG TPA: hypothetical protein VIK72_00475 [Clostridiaceae bacterium]
MRNIGFIISLIGTLLGSAIIIRSFIGFKKIHKMLKEIDDEQFDADYFKGRFIKYTIYKIIGISIASISSIIGIFLR